MFNFSIIRCCSICTACVCGYFHKIHNERRCTAADDKVLPLDERKMVAGYLFCFINYLKFRWWNAQLI